MKKIKISFIFIYSVLLCEFIFAENPDTTITLINKRSRLIESASSLTGINSEYLTAIIYVERTENFNWEDEIADILLAKSGVNSSIGFCQVKLKTAYFIERSIAKQYLPISKNADEIIEKLENDSLNILYAASYIRLMIDRWAKDGFFITKRPEILGTLYSTGMYYRDGRERLPNDSAQPNEFGIKVKKFLDNQKEHHTKT